MLMQGDEEFRPVTSRVWSIAERVEDMDAMGIDFQLLSATPINFQYHRRPQVTLQVAEYFNDLALEMCEESGGRIFALAQVPLQDIDLACQEASRAVKAGHKGVQIGNHVGMKDLDDKGLVRFLKHCADGALPPRRRGAMHGRSSSVADASSVCAFVHDLQEQRASRCWCTHGTCWARSA